MNQILFTLFHKWRYFFEIRFWVLDMSIHFLYLFLLKILNSAKKSEQNLVNIHSYYKSTNYWFKIVKKMSFLEKCFGMYCNINFNENCSYDSRVVPCGWTDMTKLTVAYPVFRTHPTINRRSVLLLTASCHTQN